jgi:hypothetical protein
MEADLVMREKGPGIDNLAEIPTGELIDRYSIGVERIDPRAFELDNDLLDTAFLESAEVGKWPVRVLIGHLADCEILNVNRLRRTIAEDAPMLQGFDPDSYIDNGLYKIKAKDAPGDSARAACGAFVATIHTLRSWTTDWLLSLDDAAWSRKAMHVTRGEFTTKRLLALATWHIEYHASFLPGKIDLLLGKPGPGSE